MQKIFLLLALFCFSKNGFTQNNTVTQVTYEESLKDSLFQNGHFEIQTFTVYSNKDSIRADFEKKQAQRLKEMNTELDELMWRNFGLRKMTEADVWIPTGCFPPNLF